MKLVETDIPHGEAEAEVTERPRPPRPEHRRVYVSLLVTLSVLCATVVTIYTLFPKRDNEVLTSAIDAHRERDQFHTVSWGADQLDAWTIGVLGERVPWPMPDTGRELVATRAVRVLHRPAAMVRYEIAGNEVTVVAMRARDAPPRRYRRSDAGHVALSWRDGPWTFVAVGPSPAEDAWREPIGAP